MSISNRFLSSNTVLIHLCYHLSIRDIVILGKTCQNLHQRLFSEGEIWKARSLIFRPQDRPWILQPLVIQKLIPTLPRYHGLKKLVIHDIPTLDSMTLLLIFDHCAHSIHHLDLILSHSQCHELCMHLQAFCFHLATSQAWNKIPLTLHQYTLDSTQLYHQAQQSLQSLPHQPFLINQLIAQGLPTRMDDPPFEMLEQISISIPASPAPQIPTCDTHLSSAPSASLLIQQFHHLTVLLSRHTPALTLPASFSSASASASPPIRPNFNSPHRGTSISGYSNAADSVPNLSVSSSLTSKSSSRINITSLIEKRQSTEMLTGTTMKRKKSASHKEQQYYDRIAQLSHHYHSLRPRSVSNSPPPSPPTPPAHRDDSFRPTTVSAPIVHVMRYQRPRPKK
ncbi:hypothetical protein [Absidia glauca]|uniref:F-box domain-containing protein n=1 Tax=Absidia glauca TaxID=4829 RepID=A0A163MAD9_ABSGL|nr:hypothetical protein [Absidia glauca]